MNPRIVRKINDTKIPSPGILKPISDSSLSTNNPSIELNNEYRI
jgi:hypothetical protein